MKAARHSMIMEIIRNNEIETQEQLCLELLKAGIQVTQATVSRDIKELRLVKVMASSGKYCYAIMDAEKNPMLKRFMRIFSETVISIVHTGNQIVIKTISASAGATAEAIDSLNWPEVLGTIAGDNTLLVIVNSAKNVKDVIDRFNSLIK